MLTSSSQPAKHNKERPRSRPNTSSPRLHAKRVQQESPQSHPVSPTTIAYNPPIRSLPIPTAKPTTIEQGTQYTPPDWPPTSERSSLYAASHPDLTTIEVDAPAAISGYDGSTDSSVSESQKVATQLPAEPAEPAESAEPQVRVTLQTSIANVHTPSRRQQRDGTEEQGESSSPVKRTRSIGRNITILPIDYAECDAKILASIIADMLMELIRFNDEIPLGNGHLTRFHSRAPPGISVHDYLARLTYHATLSPPILLSMVYYIDKLCALYPSFTINSLTVHRFLIVAATVASKGLSDSFWTNNTYARVGGVSLKELALLELEFLTRLQWRIVPSPEGLVDYYKNLVGRSVAYAVAAEDTVAVDDAEVHTDGHVQSTAQSADNSSVQEAMDTSGSSMRDERG